MVVFAIVSPFVSDFQVWSRKIYCWNRKHKECHIIIPLFIIMGVFILLLYQMGFKSTCLLFVILKVYSHEVWSIYLFKQTVKLNILIISWKNNQSFDLKHVRQILIPVVTALSRDHLYQWLYFIELKWNKLKWFCYVHFLTKQSSWRLYSIFLNLCGIKN